MARYPVRVKIQGVNGLLKQLDKLAHEKLLKAARAGTNGVAQRTLQVMRAEFRHEDIRASETTIHILGKKIHALRRSRSGYMGIIGPTTKNYAYDVPDVKRLQDPKRYKKRSKRYAKVMPTKVIHLYDRGTTMRRTKEGYRRGMVQQVGLIATVSRIIAPNALHYYAEAMVKYLLRG